MLVDYHDDDDNFDDNPDDDNYENYPHLIVGSGSMPSPQSGASTKRSLNVSYFDHYHNQNHTFGIIIRIILSGS